MLVVFTVLLKLLDVAVWIIQAGHSATQGIVVHFT